MPAASVDRSADPVGGPPVVGDVEPIVAGVAHDFGNLLAVITNYLSLAARRVEDPTTSELLDQVRLAARRASRLNRQLHDLGECGRLTAQPVPVNDVVRAVQPSVREVLPEGCDLRVDLAEGTLMAMASTGALEMALRHLADNAGEAMPEGGVLTIATRPVEGGVEISVSDTGTGMTPEVVAQATEARFSTRPKGQVSGLGLTIVDRVVRTLGGDLHIESTAGSGTTVGLRLRGGTDG